MFDIILLSYLLWAAGALTVAINGLVKDYKFPGFLILFFAWPIVAWKMYRGTLKHL